MDVAKTCFLFVFLSLFYCCKLRAARWVNYGAQKANNNNNGDSNENCCIEFAVAHLLYSIHHTLSLSSNSTSTQLLLIQLLLPLLLLLYFFLFLPCGIVRQKEMIFDQNLMI